MRNEDIGLVSIQPALVSENGSVPPPGPLLPRIQVCPPQPPDLASFLQFATIPSLYFSGLKTHSFPSIHAFYRKLPHSKLCTLICLSSGWI